MALTFTPHWAIPTLFVLLAGVVVSVFTSGCVAPVEGIDLERDRPEVCGGAVCFAPTDVAVKRWSAGEITVVAWRATDGGCEEPRSREVETTASEGTSEAPIAPQITPPDASRDPVEGLAAKSSAWAPGTAIELKLHAATPGARLPMFSRAHAEDLAASAPWATARAIRVGKDDGRALADEEAVAGEATVLTLDPHTGRIRVRVKAKWSSGVSGEFLVDVDGPHGCDASAR